jgi:hypothetical protein
LNLRLFRSKVSPKKEGAASLFGLTLTEKVWGIKGETPALLRFEASEGGGERSIGDSPKYDGAALRLGRVPVPVPVGRFWRLSADADTVVPVDSDPDRLVRRTGLVRIGEDGSTLWGGLRDELLWIGDVKRLDIAAIRRGRAGEPERTVASRTKPTELLADEFLLPLFSGTLACGVDGDSPRYKGATLRLGLLFREESILTCSTPSGEVASSRGDLFGPPGGQVVASRGDRFGPPDGDATAFLFEPFGRPRPLFWGDS